MNQYEINDSTFALIPISDKKTRVFEEKRSFIVKMNAMNIIKNSCEFFGSSYLGRKWGTKNLTGITHKAPIIIEESKNMIYFPTTSPRLKECIWLSLRHIKDYKNNNGKSTVIFENGQAITLDISYFSLDNQYLRATKLDLILNKRKN